MPDARSSSAGLMAAGDGAAEPFPIIFKYDLPARRDPEPEAGDWSRDSAGVVEPEGSAILRAGAE